MTENVRLQAILLGVALPPLCELEASLAVLVQRYALGMAGALLLTSLVIGNRFGRDLLETVNALFNPLPALALFPLALNAYTGFGSVPETLRMAGRNYGLNGPRLVFQVMIPAALPAILSSLKIGWAFAWRTLIAAELVFGTTSGKGGLGWYIFQSRNELFTDKVFAGLAAVIVIGLLVEGLVFQTLERLTVRRWGMQRQALGTAS